VNTPLAEQLSDAKDVLSNPDTWARASATAGEMYLAGKVVESLGKSTVKSGGNKVGIKGAKASSSSNTFDEALKQLEKSGLKPGQTEISRSRVMQIVDDYNPLKAYSSVYTDATGQYLVEGHHTTVATKMLGRDFAVNMNLPTLQPPSAFNVHWTKKWYEFWKTSIKVKN
jgi:hypothetical protein